MSIHKLTAGSGYDYLTRQVAAQDATDKGHVGLAGYYAAKGEAPGLWLGSGLAGIDGVSAGDVVTQEQMQALFGSGHHPLAKEHRDALAGPDVADADVRRVTRLGTPYKVYSGDVSAFRVEVASRIAALNDNAGIPRDWPVPMADRARVRTQVATEFFRAEYGRDPEDAREIAATIAKHSRPKTTAVAGYDLTFSPVKSVSTLWAIASPDVASKIERAHNAAVQDALAFIEKHALYTRVGTNGVRQVDVQGLVATAFTHRDSRAGDPDLHTHVAVANKVQTFDGRWLSIDGRVLFKATVAASETYNTALEKHLGANLGLRFQERPGTDARSLPIREVVGVDPRLNQRWSARRASIEARRSTLATEFQATHDRPPTPIESIHLAQQATLETRQAKHEPRSLAEQRQSWRVQAVDTLGGERHVDAMVRTALSPRVAAAHTPTASWITATADRVLAALEARRSSWQVWHVRAEAQRRVRAADVPAEQVEQVVGLLVDEVLTARSVCLARPDDGIPEPDALRRRDGTSVYTVAGADQYTSARILAAEQRLVATAGRTDGYAVPTAAVDLALLESAANGISLNPGQAALIRGMATSGVRLQLGIAPAGAGKTTAMRTLAAAWIEGGGTVIGLAPSAAAAAALREQTRAHTDTLAKLTWSIAHDDLPDWATTIGPSTLVVIDEAGMADTLSLDAAVHFVVERRGSVRLIGDDQQLAAIGAGGVLRDIDATHGALRLSELRRFADPTEAAATLALRDGKPEALGFYLDHGRVHVGDLATLSEQVFSGWQSDRARGLDAIMLAPTRDLVAELNQRARAHRLAEATTDPRPESAVMLADGNEASVGDVIITRSNDRTLRLTSTDWVKNGDRWTVLAVDAGRDVRVQHSQNRRIVTLPADYVAESTGLGYATTVHTAQGVSVDVMHGLATGQEARQQLYTMMTRGRFANHLYLQVVGDGNPHNVIRPDHVAPRTATDILHGILARDDSPVSASTMLREQSDPAVLLGQATARYVDALYAAAEHVLGSAVVAQLDAQADALVPDVSHSAAWPTLRAHLLLIGAQGGSPLAALRLAADTRELDSAGDRAAVLDWRLDDTGLRNAGRGPLPWLPAIPAALAQDPTWGEYLHKRADLVARFSEQVAVQSVDAGTPSWAHHTASRPSPSLATEVEVWRAAMLVPPDDARPTGAPQFGKAAALWQRGLERRLNGGTTPALQEWAPLLESVAPQVRHDDFLPRLADRLAAVSRAGLDARGLIRRALTEGSLPDDHAAAAMWWRIGRHLAPAVMADADRGHLLAASWVPRLVDGLGHPEAEALQGSTWWPALVATIDHGLQRGWTLDDLLNTARSAFGNDEVEPCQAIVWRITVMTDPPPSPEDRDDGTLDPPDDLCANVEPPVDAATAEEWARYVAGDVDVRHKVGQTHIGPAEVVHEHYPADDVPDVEAELRLAAMMRQVMGPLEPSDAEVEHMLQRAVEWDYAPVARERMVQVNEMTLAYFQSQLDRAWARGYLADRFGEDVAGHPYVMPGYAPAGWTHLVDHLHRLGVADLEMTETGVATLARTGRLIDRFRDRVMLPITHQGNVLGFVGRRRPDIRDDGNAGSKYLNTADTVLFHKGAQLYGVIPHLLEAGAVPVLVEGPMDAVAVTLASGGSQVGLAPLGTALSQEQAAQLASFGRDPIVATDGDLAGHLAAERDFWLLAQHGLNPAFAQFPEGSDPSDVLARRGPAALKATLAGTRRLAHALIDERLTNPFPGSACGSALTVLAALPAEAWDDGSRRIAIAADMPARYVRASLLAAVRGWNHDPRNAVSYELARVRARPKAAVTPISDQPPQLLAGRMVSKAVAEMQRVRMPDAISPAGPQR